ncbi:hypothetical protein RJ639_046832 [Escallonia herrerae]|uniref:Transducin/WD40 repeat-like superfamily protein n=1 Tax=Escallonia herrerae TaxID=1293975 RepID=A0AA88W5H4_9ASTE|nr:hypothetical protein RJ639_046832 [Escallonia herrerae]
MKCRPVACIWSVSPPAHRVTATAALDRPPTLYTGGSDGTIVRWNLPPTDPNNSTCDHNEVRDLKPMAVLCGHAAPIADLGICFPASVLGDEKIDDSSNVATNSNSVKYAALISACTDGVLCVWSRSGHCRRRRKVPPWVGSPSMIRPLPENRRYICVACCFVDSAQQLDRQSPDSTEGAEVLANTELLHSKPLKCTVVVVDSYTLSIVQTVFHGNLSIGPLKYMSVIMSVEDVEKQSVLMVDSSGKGQCVSVLKDTDPNAENLTTLRKSSSQQELTDWLDDSKERGPVVAFATCGQVLALVYRSCCVFRLVDGGITVGEISFLDDELNSESNCSQSHVIGGMFLDSDDARMPLSNSEVSHNKFVERIVFWNNRGCAIIYTVSFTGHVFKFERLCATPAVLHPPHVKSFIRYIQLNGHLLCIDSSCYNDKEPLLWKPNVTLWLLPRQNETNREDFRECKMLAQGSFFDSWTLNSTDVNKSEGPRLDVGVKPNGQESEITSQPSFALRRENAADIHVKDENFGLYQKGRVVSTSMVISENYLSPYAIVYGFYSGEIEVSRFDLYFEGLGSHNGTPSHEADSRASRQYLKGHTGSILCLAAHQMVSTSKGGSSTYVLLSGSIDCTVRIWDLDSSNLIKVMYQHVAPVRQIVLAPAGTDRPWSDCFLSVGEDSCVALASLETLRVERMFPGHPTCPGKVVWDTARGYVACLCLNHSGTSDVFDVLYIWDVKTGSRERVLRGAAAHSMFDNFCKGNSMNSFSNSVMNGNTSASSLLFPMAEDSRYKQSNLVNSGKKATSSNISTVTTNPTEPSTSLEDTSKGSNAKLCPSILPVSQINMHPIKCSCPFPGVATLTFDLASIMTLCLKPDFFKDGRGTQEPLGAETPTYGHKKVNGLLKGHRGVMPSPHHLTRDDGSCLQGTSTDNIENSEWVKSLEGRLLQFSLSFLHLWDVDSKLDKLLISEMQLKRPENFIVSSGLLGDRGAITVAFPGSNATLELWKSSSEFCVIRSLTMVSLAQHMISLSHSCSAASSALAAFYARNFAEKFPDMKPPLLQLLVSFWQDKCEHVRMAARSLFHCAASRAIPLPLCSEKAIDHAKLLGPSKGIVESCCDNSSMDGTSANNKNSIDHSETQRISQAEDSEIVSWLDSFEVQDWISCVEGTSQDAMTSHIIVAAALAVWYPSLVKPSLALLAVHPLTKLVMAMNEKYSSTAAEILAEGMESTWKTCIGSEIPRLIGDIFFQIECVSGASADSSTRDPATSFEIRETLVGILLPSLAMADIQGFLNVIESQIWSTASDSPVHVVSLMTLIRVIRGSPRNLAQYLDKVVNFILQTMDPGNSVMRKTCLHSSMAALKETVRVFPMVALNDAATRLAVGDAIGETKNASIWVYEMQSTAKIKVLDASGPPGLPSLIGGSSETASTTAISALSFSPDGEGLLAFSEHGLMIRWWSLGSVWWEKLSRNLVPVHCTKLIFVPPWEGFSPNSTRSSIMASVMGNERPGNMQENARSFNETDRVKLLIHNLDLSYRLEWVGERKVQLTQHGHELSIFQL